MEVRIYIEGGGDTGSQKGWLRTGFSEFLSELRDWARSRRQRFSIICCGGRDSTLEDFRNALQDHPDAFNILLIDAEDSVVLSPRAHLEKRDGWKLADLEEEQVHLMVALMESWFLADQEALEKFFGAGFRGNALPQRTNVEENPKADVEKGLNDATRQKQKRALQKNGAQPAIARPNFARQSSQGGAPL